MECQICGTPLTGGLDTFGTITEPTCAYCHTGFCDDCDDRIGDCWYGLGPHRHDLSITGSMIGSTVLEDLSQYPKDQEDRYIVGPGLYFIPDPSLGDGPGMGIWIQE